MKKFLFIFFTFFLLSLFITGCSSDKVTIKFETNGGSKIENISIDKNTKITLPDDPTKDGFDFKGWFTDSALTIEYKNEAITSNITLYAKWDEMSSDIFEVKFNSDGGSSVTSQTIEKGKTATEPANPNRTGYKFDGWYLGNTKFDFTKPITSNITLVAKWSQNDNLFDVVEPKDVKYSPEVSKKIYDLLVSIKFDGIGEINEETNEYIPYKFEDENAQLVIDSVIDYFKLSKLLESDLDYLINLLENNFDNIDNIVKEKPIIETVEFLVTVLFEEAITNIDEDVIGQLLYGLAILSFENQIDQCQYEIDYYTNELLKDPENENYFKQLETLKKELTKLMSFKEDLDDAGMKSFIIISRTIMRVYSAFKENDGLSLFDLVKEGKLTNQEILEIIKIFANTLKDINMSDETWARLFEYKEFSNFLINYMNMNTNSEVPKVYEIILEKELILFGKNFKLILTVLSDVLLEITIEDLKYIFELEKPYTEKKQIFYTSNYELISKTQYSLTTTSFDATIDIYNKLNDLYNQFKGNQTTQEIIYFYNQETQVYKISKLTFKTLNINNFNKYADFLNNLQIQFTKDSSDIKFYSNVYTVYVDDQILIMTDDEFTNYMRDNLSTYYIYKDGMFVTVTSQEYENERDLYFAKQVQVIFKYLHSLLTKDGVEELIFDFLEIAEEEVKNIAEGTLEEPVVNIVTIEDVYELIEEMINLDIKVDNVDEIDELYSEFMGTLNIFLLYQCPYLMEYIFNYE